MDLIKKIFWNRKETRLRSAYRIIIAVILTITLGYIIATLTGIRPVLNPQTPYWQFLYKGAIRITISFLAVWLAGHFLDKRLFTDFGLSINKDWWIDFTFGVVLGTLAISSIFIFQYSAGWIKVTDTFYVSQESQSFIIPLVVFLFLFICVGVDEELRSRGYILTNIAEGLSSKRMGQKVPILLALIISSSMFSLFHIGNPNITTLALLNIILAGIILGTAFVLTGQLALSIGLHIAWNFFQGPVFGFPVSGQSFAGVASVIKIEQGGPEFWTGGAFGPEAGMIGILAMISGILIILGWAKFRYGKIKFFTSITIPPNINSKRFIEIESNKN